MLSQPYSLNWGQGHVFFLLTGSMNKISSENKYGTHKALYFHWWCSASGVWQKGPTTSWTYDSRMQSGHKRVNARVPILPKPDLLLATFLNLRRSYDRFTPSSWRLSFYSICHFYPIISLVTSYSINFIEEDDAGLLGARHFKQLSHHPRPLHTKYRNLFRLESRITNLRNQKYIFTVITGFKQL